ncbi:hypothetical protein A2115_01635 [Candidatus Woesebacteria bacterium GWA1_41_8]|uniref:Methyltransferase type 11 domain-containing protein n=1 Tax=Candidatus Woesebacteria bacterium GWA1_41_8 TaxID=1802471 RepID=A0A1F7WGR3_9BACT|nr:MAG: hypothetical protein A2115_01635 [Candidatus Woesebacteria bacterium GWA1_41_8]
MKKQRTSLSISVRRHFVDNFFFSHKLLFAGKKIIDIGGKKINKRGLFDISSFSADVTYVNIEKKDGPDILTDATNIPVPDNSFDIAIMGELLEHVSDPKAVLREARRILKPGGKILVSVPFMVGIHGDPYDYGRYTDTFWRMTAEELGFSIMEIKPQGTMFAVFALMIQHLFLAKHRSLRPVQTPLIRFLMWLDRKTINPLLRSWTTGYGIILEKIK